MSIRSWNKKSRKVSASNTIPEETYQFFQTLASKIRPNGNLHIGFLRLAGIPIAGVIGMSFINRYVGLQTIFDDNYADYSPGFLVCGYDIKWAMENGYSEFDFMSGFLTNKLPWTDSYRKHHVLRIFRKHAFSGCFYLAKFRVVPILRKILEKRLPNSAKNFSGYHDSVVGKSKANNYHLQDENGKLKFSPTSSKCHNSR